MSTMNFFTGLPFFNCRLLIVHCEESRPPRFRRISVGETKNMIHTTGVSFCVRAAHGDEDKAGMT
jgi:hypothetical protein